MKGRLNDLKNVLILVIVIFIFIISFNHGVVQYYDYIKYCINKDDYFVVNAKIKEIHNFEWEYRKTVLFSLKRILVTYKMGDKQYEQYTIGYPEKEEGETVKIGVKKDNSKINRCEKYNFTEEDKILYFNLLIITIFIFIFCFFLSHMMDKYKKKKTDYFEMKIHEKNLYQKQQKIEEIEKKQAKILELCGGKSNFVERTEILEDLKMNDIILNEGSLWCVRKLGIINNLILTSLDLQDKSECVNHTNIARNDGLANDYYVIAVKDGYYLCCSSKTERVYSFSGYLGITNTQYSDIYDYLIDELTKEH